MSGSDDFGFSFEDVNVSQLVKDAASSQTMASVYEQSLIQMYERIDILLTNLSQNPEKDMIKWPNRRQEIDKFRQSITGFLPQDYKQAKRLT